MRALTSYDLPAIACNLAGVAWRRAKHYARLPVRWVGFVAYCLCSGLMLATMGISVLLAAAGRGLLPREYEHVDERLTTILEDVLKEPAD